MEPETGEPFYQFNVSAQSQLGFAARTDDTRIGEDQINQVGAATNLHTRKLERIPVVIIRAV